MCNFQCKIINQHTIALQNTFCKWSWYETKSIVHFTKKGQSTPRLFVFNYQYTNKKSWIRWHSAIMYRYRCPHIYTPLEKNNPIFKTWFVQVKISSDMWLLAGVHTIYIIWFSKLWEHKYIHKHIHRFGVETHILHHKRHKWPESKGWPCKMTLMYMHVFLPFSLFASFFTGPHTPGRLLVLIHNWATIATRFVSVKYWTM